MASPQLENGYTKIANEIIDSLVRWQFSSYEWRCLLFIIRKTYGWGKKTDWISLEQFSEATGIKRTHVSRTIKILVTQNIVTKRGNGVRQICSFNKDFDTWKRLPKGVRTHSRLPKGVMGVTKRGNPRLPKGVTTKETITKETITKEIATQSVAKDIVKLFDVFRPINPLLNYGNKTDRRAAEDLFTKFGVEKTLRTAEYAVSLHGEKYAPTITNPYQMKQKLSELMSFFKKNTKSNITVV